MFLRSTLSLTLGLGLASSAHAGFAGPSDLGQAGGDGATVYQMDGTRGVVPMVETADGLKLATTTLSETVNFMATLDCPSSHHPHSFTVYDYGDAWGQQSGEYNDLLPNPLPGQESWQSSFPTRPWELDNVEAQCAAALDNGNGTYKPSAKITLVSDGQFHGDAVTFAAHCARNGNPAAPHVTYEGSTNPSTSVTCQLSGARMGVRPGGRMTAPAAIPNPGRIGTPMPRIRTRGPETRDPASRDTQRRGRSVRAR